MPRFTRHNLPAPVSGRSRFAALGLSAFGPINPRIFHEARKNILSIRKHRVLGKDQGFVIMAIQHLSQGRPVGLIAENEFVIGMDIEAHLDDLGFDTGALVPSCAAALLWLSANTPQVAILDYFLKDGPCTELVQVLKRRGVPILIYSGEPRGGRIGPDWDQVAWLEKPARLTEALRVLTAAALSRQASRPSRRRPSSERLTIAATH